MKTAQRRLQGHRRGLMRSTGKGLGREDRGVREGSWGKTVGSERVHGARPRGQSGFMGQDRGVREGSWGKTKGSEKVHGASFVTSKSERPGRGISSTVPFNPHPCSGSTSLSHWAAREVPGKISLFQVYCPLFSP